MSNEIVVGNHVLTGTESLFATLTTWHEFVDVYVDGSLDAAIPDSQWSVYAITSGTRTKLAGGTVNADPTNGQRVLAGVPGKGTTIELWARSVYGASGGAIKAAIVGWSPDSATTNPDDATDAAITLTTNTRTFVCNVTWHPLVTAIVQAGAPALGSLWTIEAVIAGLTSAIPVATGQFLDVVPSRFVIEATGGATSWNLAARSPVGNTGVCDASLFGQSGIEATLLPTASAVVLSGLDTTGITDGDFVYMSSAETVLKTDAGNLSKSRCVGASIGASGSIVLAGAIVDAKFTTAGGAPAVGAPVYLAPASDDGATAAGKLTATAPSAVNVVAVGICYDASAYAGTKRARVTLQLAKFDGPAANVKYTDTVPLLVPTPAGGAGNATTQEAIDSAKRNLPIHLRQVPRATVAGTPNQITAAGAYPYVNATADVIVLPDNAKVTGQNVGSVASSGTVWVRAGATLGQLGGVNTQAPGLSNFGTSWTGDLLIGAANVATSVDAAYLPERYDVVEATYACTPGTGVVNGLPSGLIFILEAEALAGGVTGKNIVVAPAATAPTTRQAGLTLGKTGVFFCIADAVTSVRLKLGVIPVENY